MESGEEFRYRIQVLTAGPVLTSFVSINEEHRTMPSLLTAFVMMKNIQRQYVQ
jgi:hypothetical protein